MSECSHVIEKFTLVSQAGKGQTGEVEHSDNIDCLSVEKISCRLL